jgi:hypothetical protein
VIYRLSEGLHGRFSAVSPPQRRFHRLRRHSAGWSHTGGWHEGRSLCAPTTAPAAVVAGYVRGALWGRGRAPGRLLRASSPRCSHGRGAPSSAALPVLAQLRAAPRSRSGPRSGLGAPVRPRSASQFLRVAPLRYALPLQKPTSGARTGRWPGAPVLDRAPIDGGSWGRLDRTRGQHLPCGVHHCINAVST